MSQLALTYGGPWTLVGTWSSVPRGSVWSRAGALHWPRIAEEDLMRCLAFEGQPFEVMVEEAVHTVERRGDFATTRFGRWLRIHSGRPLLLWYSDFYDDLDEQDWSNEILMAVEMSLREDGEVFLQLSGE